MSEEDRNLDSLNNSSNQRKCLEEALAVWEDVGAELKRLLAAVVPDELSIRELESKTEKLLSAVKALEGEREETHNAFLKQGAHARISGEALDSQGTGIPIPERQYFKIGEGSEMLDVEPYMLRYWESEFKILKPTRTRARQRLYHKKDVERLELIKHLTLDEKFTISATRRRLREIEKEHASRAKGASAVKTSSKIPAGQRVTTDNLPAAANRQNYGELLFEIKKMLKEIKERLES